MTFKQQNQIRSAIEFRPNTVENVRSAWSRFKAQKRGTEIVKIRIDDPSIANFDLRVGNQFKLAGDSRIYEVTQ